MLHKCLGFVLLAGLTLAVGMPARGQEKKEPAEETAAKQAEAVAKIAAAFELADEGRKTKSPELLLSAALILRRIPAPTEAETTTEREVDGKAVTGKAEKPETGTLHSDSDKLLVEAKKIAQDLKAVGKMLAEEMAGIEALAKRIADAPLERGAFGGPKFYRDIVPAKGSNSISIPFVKGIPAAVALRGYGNTPIQVTVWKGTTKIASHSGVVVQLRWLPTPGKGTQQFRITVRNLGTATTAYQLFTN